MDAAQSIRSTGRLLRAIYETARTRDLSMLAASVTYYAFVSLIPLIVLALAVGSLVGGERFAEALVLLVADALPAEGEDILLEILATEVGRAQATLIALPIGAWGVFKIVRGLTISFDRLYGEMELPTLRKQVIEATVVSVGIIVALTIMLLVGGLIGLLRLDLGPLVVLSGWFGLFLGLTLAFLPMYYTLPPIRVTLVEALPGTVLAAGGLTVLQLAFQAYAASASRLSTYGVLGTILLFVTFLYFAGLLVMLGVVVNVALGHPDRLVRPTTGGAADPAS